MRTSYTYVLGLVLVLLASSCCGLRSESTHNGNAETSINRVERAADSKNDTNGDNDTKYPAPEHHSAGTTPDTKTQNEERGFLDLFKFKNPLRKNDALKTISQKDLASDTLMAVAQKNPASSRLVGILGKNQPKLTEKDASFFKNNPVFGKMKEVFAKKTGAAHQDGRPIDAAVSWFEQSKVAVGE